ncbi:MAG TPA: TIGR01841 family phasin [Burkholderiaceae bacterium]
MFSNPEQFANATKTLFEFQLETFNMLTSKTIQGVEQVVALNVDTAKNAVSGSLAKAEKMSAAKSPQDAMAGAADGAAMQEVTEYQHQLAAIVSNIQKEFADAADAHMAEAKSNLSALIYDVTKNVRPGSENAVAIVKTAIDNAFAGYEQVTRATRQAVATVEEQVARATAELERKTAEAAAMGKGAAEQAKPPRGKK